MFRWYLTVLVSWIAVVCPALASDTAYESAYLVAPEIHRSSSARAGETLPKYTTALGWDFSYFRGYSFLYPSDRSQFMGHRIALHYGVLDWLQLRADLKQIRGDNNLVFPDRLSAFGDTDLAVRVRYWHSDSLSLSAEPVVQLLSGVPGEAGFGTGYAVGLYQNLSWRSQGLAVHTHLGYMHDRSSAALGLEPTLMESTAFDVGDRGYFDHGLRGEYHWRALVPYLQYTGRYRLGDAGSGPHRLTPGVLISPQRWLHWHLASDFRIVSEKQTGLSYSPPWNLHTGLTAQFGVPELLYRLKQTVRPTPGVLQLRVFSTINGQSVGRAPIQLFDSEEQIRATGFGQLEYNGYPERMTYAVVLQGYTPVTGNTYVQGGRLTVVEIPITPRSGWISGQLISHVDGVLPQMRNGRGEILVSGEQAFVLSVQPGEYTLEATATGAVPATTTVRIELGQTVKLGRINLLPPGLAPASLSRAPATGPTPAPDTELLMGPKDYVRTATAVIEFGSYSFNAASFECSLNRAAWVACESPWELAGLKDGLYKAQIRAVADDATVDATPVEVKWRVDTREPDSRITWAPKGEIDLTLWSIWFESTDGDIQRFECNFDNGGFVPCESPAQISSTVLGEHSLLVRAVDRAGNTETSPAEASWVLKKPRKQVQASSEKDFFRSVDDKAYGSYVAQPEPERILEIRGVSDINREALRNGVPAGTFASGVAELSEATKERLDKIAELVSNDPTLRALVIEGSVDSMGGMELNSQLARKRAQNAYDHLRDRGVDPSKMGIKVAIFVRSPGNLTAGEQARERGVVIRAIYELSELP